MTLSKQEMRTLLTENKLRSTAPRLAVLKILAEADTPLSHTEVLAHLGEMDWDPATIFRNLVKLKEAGIALVISRANGIDRYVLKGSKGDLHRHPHFSCNECGQMTCLPDTFTNATALEGPWAEAVAAASVQLSGQCPDCL